MMSASKDMPLLARSAEQVARNPQAPAVIDQSLTCDHTPRLTQQALQQIEFGWCQQYRPPATTDQMRVCVQPEIRDVQPGTDRWADAATKRP